MANDLVRGDGASGLLAQAEGAIRPLTKDEIERKVREGHVFEKAMTIPAGSIVEGTYLGEGEPIGFVADEKTGEVRNVRTWRVQVAAGFVLRVISSTRLDSEMPRVPVGATVTIIRPKDKIRTRRGFEMNDYSVTFAPKAK